SAQSARVATARWTRAAGNPNLQQQRRCQLRRRTDRRPALPLGGPRCGWGKGSAERLLDGGDRARRIRQGTARGGDQGGENVDAGLCSPQIRRPAARGTRGYRGGIGAFL